MNNQQLIDYYERRVQADKEAAKNLPASIRERADYEQGHYHHRVLLNVVRQRPFTGPATYCRCWSAHRIISPLPHASSQVTKHEQFRHGLLATINSRSTVIYACGPHREHGLGD
jgi:hypothetical protein